MGGREGCALLFLAISSLEGNEINQQQLDTLSAAAESRSCIFRARPCKSYDVQFRINSLPALNPGGYGGGGVGRVSLVSWHGTVGEERKGEESRHRQGRGK